MKMSFEDVSLVWDHAQNYPGLRIIPIRAKQVSSNSATKLLWEGIENQSITIEELKSSSVPEVQLTNKTEDTFLGYRGTIIRGGGQNRQLLHSFLVPKKSTIKIPVQCIQQGRWNPHQSKHFTTKSQDVTSSTVRFGKKTQGETWSMITETASLHSTPTPTMDYTTTNDLLYGSESEYETATAFTSSFGGDRKKHEKARLRAQEILQASEPLPDQIGVYIQVIDLKASHEKGEARFRQCMEVFSSPHLYQKVHKDILSSFITDVVPLSEKLENRGIELPPVDEASIRDFFQKIRSASWKAAKNIGSEKREEIGESQEVFGETIYENEEMVHMMCSVQ